MSKTHIYVISDSLGETCESLAKAAAIQFNSSIGGIYKFPFVSSKLQIDTIIEKASASNSLILYTLVSPENREYISNRCLDYNIISIDVLGPVLDGIQSISHKKPIQKAGLNRKLDDEYFDKVKAVEFAVKYDDCKNPKGILMADIVLIGISRTSKTPLSMYLAYKNYKVTNIPLMPEIEPPKELFMIPSNKIVGLTNEPDKLNIIRTERLKDLGISNNSNYAQLERIENELKFSDELFKKLNCMVINVSSKAIEEIANIIITSIV